jgi:hypothetical protein
MSASQVLQGKQRRKIACGEGIRKQQRALRAPNEALEERAQCKPLCRKRRARQELAHQGRFIATTQRQVSRDKGGKRRVER